MENSQPMNAASMISVPASRGIKPLLGYHILLVDDSPDPRRLNLQLLEVAGAQVTLECHALAGAHLAIADPHRFHAVIMDLSSPRLDGEEAVGVARSAGFDRPIIVLVSMVTCQEEMRLLRAGFSKVLIMPRHPDVFISEIAEEVAIGQRELFPDQIPVLPKSS